MNRLRRFRHRSPAERKLLWRTAVLFLCAHVLARQRELGRTRRAMSAIARRLHARAHDPGQLSWAVTVVTHNLPGHHSCLISALTCEAIATNSNITTEFRIGAARAGERMHFHAWVEHDGAALTGAHDGEFAPLR